MKMIDFLANILSWLNLSLVRWETGWMLLIPTGTKEHDHDYLTYHAEGVTNEQTDGRTDRI